MGNFPGYLWVLVKFEKGNRKKTNAKEKWSPTPSIRMISQKRMLWKKSSSTQHPSRFTLKTFSHICTFPGLTGQSSSEETFHLVCLCFSLRRGKKQVPILPLSAYFTQICHPAGTTLYVPSFRKSLQTPHPIMCEQERKWGLEFTKKYKRDIVWKRGENDSFSPTTSITLGQQLLAVICEKFFRRNAH